jgi:hypothetical protein
MIMKRSLIARWRIFDVLWQLVSDLVPRRFGSHEDVVRSTNARIAIERARRNHDEIARRNRARHRTAADSAKHVPKSSRRWQPVGYQLIVAPQPMEIHGSNVDVGRISRSANLAASRAMAVTELDLIIRLERYCAAKTTSSYHPEHFLGRGDPALNVSNQAFNSSSSDLASFRSAVSNPSVNQL